MRFRVEGETGDGYNKKFDLVPKPTALKTTELDQIVDDVNLNMNNPLQSPQIQSMLEVLENDPLFTISEDE